MTATTVMKIRPLMGFSTLDDADLEARGNAVQTGMTGNAAYPNPPVSLTVLGTAMTTLAADIAAALDGGQKAITAKNKQRDVIVMILRQLVVYVQANCNNDVAIFTSSGFQMVSSVRVPAPTLAPASIRKINQGLTGQLLVLITALAAAKTYDLRYAALAGGVPGPWTDQTLTSVRAFVPVNNLTPGTTYTFQVRALGSAGYTNWSDSVSRMTI